MVNLPGLTFRPAREEDLSQFLNLARLAFSPLRSRAESEQEFGDRPLNLPGRLGWVVENAAGSMMGRYRHLELELFFEGVCFPMAGVAEVAVALEHRGQRVAQWMLEQALKTFREQQTPLSMLYPFKHGFYRNLGWAWVGHSHQYRISPRHMPPYPERLNICALDATQHGATLNLIYEAAAPQHNGWLRREPWLWKPHLSAKSGQEIYGYSEAGEWLGYVVFQFAHLDAAKLKLAVIIQEWVALTSSAYRGIIGFLASLRDQCSTVVWNTYPGDPFPHLLKEQRRDPTLPTPPFEFGLSHHFGEIGGGFMWRLVDVAKALELRPIQHGEPFAIQFQVTDPVFGKETIAVDLVDGKMYPTQHRGSTLLRLSVEHLTALFSGARTATQLAWTGEIEVEGDRSHLAKLDRAWQADPPFCWNFF